ncbi:MAG: bifunctional nuclease family protein [bacterium]|nr:bifunctional nuclease family protein [bacterium]
MTKNDSENTVEMFVGGLVLDPSTQAPIVILKDEQNQFCLPIWIGMAEATSIATVLKNVKLVRPMTHDLLYESITKFGIKVKRVVISDLREATYYAEIILTHGDEVTVLDSRPSDAIAIALRASASIFVAKDVLEQAKVAVVPGEILSDGSSVPVAGEESVEDTVIESAADERDFNTIDKDKWSEILADLDPDDFKHKM